MKLIINKRNTHKVNKHTFFLAVVGVMKAKDSQVATFRVKC